MSCCTLDRSYDAQFDADRAAKDLERFRKDGPDATTRALIDVLRSAGVQGCTLLDVGGGIGAVHHELLDAGVTSATQVDASAPYTRAAGDEAARRSHAGRVRFVHGDFVAVAPTVEPADIVTLDRVICCYADMESLVAASASRARRLYGAVFPRDRWFLRLGFAVANLFKALIRNPFRIYIHPVPAIEAALRRQGLQPRAASRTFVWHVALYSR